MDERGIINDKKIVENDLSPRCGFLIMEAVVLVLSLAILSFIMIWLFNVFTTKTIALVVKIVVLSSVISFSIFRIVSCICVIHLFKNAKFSVELDTITEIKRDRMFFMVEPFIPTRIYFSRNFKFPKKVTFENSGKIIVGKNEIAEHCRVGDKFYLVKIKIFKKYKIVSFYNEKAYFYDNNSTEK